MKPRQLSFLLIVLAYGCGYWYLRLHAVQWLPIRSKEDVRGRHFALIAPIAPHNTISVGLCNAVYLPLRKLEYALSGTEVAFHPTLIIGSTFLPLVLEN